MMLSKHSWRSSRGASRHNTCKQPSRLNWLGTSKLRGCDSYLPVASTSQRWPTVREFHKSRASFPSLVLVHTEIRNSAGTHSIVAHHPPVSLRAALQEQYSGSSFASSTDLCVTTI